MSIRSVLRAVTPVAVAASGALLAATASRPQCEPKLFTKPGTYRVGEDGKVFSFEPVAPLILNGKRFHVGQQVEAKYRNQWYKAVVKSVFEDHLVVHWLPPHEMWGEAEWYPFNASDVRVPAETPGSIAGKAFTVGERVEGLYRGQWYDCVVEHVGASSMKVRWSAPHAGWGSANWQPHDATDIRLRGGAATPRKPLREVFTKGLVVEAQYRGQWYEAVVRDVRGEDLVLEWASPHDSWGTCTWHPHSPADVRHKGASTPGAVPGSTLFENQSERW